VGVRAGVVDLRPMREGKAVMEGERRDDEDEHVNKRPDERG
jgi:hypothetical protein